MFCSSCGSPVKEGFQFCVKCGNNVSSSSDQSIVVSGEAPKSTVKPPTFNAFMLKKKDERSSHFKPKKGKKVDLDEEVCINVGIMRFNEEEGLLKPQRGKNLPLKFRKSSNSEDILALAVTKHAIHNSDEIIKSSPKRYKLLYSDGTLVQNLKESDEPFTLCKYKCEIGKPYNRLTFYICTNSDFFERSVDSFLMTNVKSSDDESEVSEVPQKKICLTKCDLTAETATCSSHILSDVKIGDEKTEVTDESGVAANKSCYASLLCSLGDSLATKSNREAKTSCPEITPHEIMKDIFPHLSDLAILNALKESGGVENAVIKLSAKTEGSSDQLIDSYASVIENAAGWDSDEFMESACKTTSDEGSSNACDKTEEEDQASISDQLKKLYKEHSDSNAEIKVKVRRSFVWEDTLLKLKRYNKESLNSGTVNVQFIGEPAVDEGGPRKELFFLIHRYMQTSCLFTGQPHSRSFAHNVIALQREEYYYYGVMSALSILQGSPGPIIFSPPVVDYIIHGTLEAVSTSISDLPTGKVRSKLEELEKINDTDVFKKEASFQTPFRFKAGYSKPIVTLQDKQEFMRCICLHYMILSTLPEIEQFIKGLNINGVLDVIRSNPTKSRKLLQFSEAEKLNADKVDQLFQFCYSPTGSNKRKDEEAIAFNFTHYLEDVEAERVSTSILDPDTDDLKWITVQLTHVLQFATGCPTIPATGFDKELSVMFNHTETQRKLTANTCSCMLYLPVSKVLTEYESFKREFTECMFSSPGFGVV